MGNPETEKRANLVYGISNKILLAWLVMGGMLLVLGIPMIYATLR